MQEWFNIGKLLSVIQHINRMKLKKMIISKIISTEALTKFLTLS